MHEDQKLAVGDLEALWQEKNLASFDGAFRTDTGEVIPVTARSPNELIEVLTTLKTSGAYADAGIGSADT